MEKRTSTPKSLVIFLVFILCFGSSTSNAQSIANYALTRTTGISYTSIANTGTPPASWRNSGAFIDDDNRSNPIDIGFDFWYDGVRYTQLSISTNGYLDFSNSTADGGPTGNPYGYVNSQFTANGGTLNAIAPFYDDMTTQGANNPLGFSIRYQLSGSAPNRILTVEWVDMAVYLNTSPSLNFQVKLHETTGVIDFLYENMTQGTATFSYTCGINGTTMNNVPTVAQLKCQQTANSTTFNNGEQNNLTVMPTNFSKLTFTPPVPLNPTGALTFTGVQTSQMTLNWTNWALNEVGYVVYNSTDGINWDFITQTASNVTNTTVNNLFSGTTYYWRVYAVTEGCLSNVLSGSQATLSGATFISITSGNWNTAGTWNANAVPGPNDNVIIANGHTVTINVNNAYCHNLTIGQGGLTSVLRFGSNNTARTLNVNGNITIATNGILTVNTASNTTHQLNLYGNLTNNNTIDFQPDANSLCNIAFLHPYATQIVSGTGSTNKYNFITVDKGSDMSRMVDIRTSTFVPATGFLTLLNGTFKISTSGVVNVTPFAGNANIPGSTRLWLNSASLTVNTTGGNVNLYGELRVTAGNMNIGNAANNCLMSNGGLFTMNGGTVTIAARFDRINVATLTRFTITGGTLIINTVGSTSTTNAPFMMDVIGSQFNQTGGLIIIRRSGGNNLGFLCTGGIINSVTGGVLQIGDALTPAGQIIQVNTVSPVGGFRVASANAVALLIANPLTIINDAELQLGTFASNNLNVTCGGNWTNTGGTYVPGTNTTTFNGGTATAINGTAVTQTFNNLVVAKTPGSTLSVGGSTTTVTVNNFTETTGNFTAGPTLNVNTSTTSSVLLSSGTFTSGTTVNVRGNWTNNGATTVPGTSTTNFTGTLAQVITGTVTAQNFYNVVILKTAGTTLSVTGSTTTLTTNDLTETSGNFTSCATLNVNASVAANVLLTAGTFTAGTTTNVTGNWTNNGGTFVPGTSTTNFTGTLAEAINGTATSQTFYNVVVAKTPGTTLSVGGSTTTLTVNNFTETSGNFTACTTLNVNSSATSSVLLTSGTFTSGTTVNVTGNWTNNGATTVPGTSTTNFTGTLAQQINGTVAAQNFYNVVVLKTVGTTLSVGGSTTTLTTNNFTETTGNFTSCATLNVNVSPAANVLLTAGTFTAGTTTNITGNWTNNGGTFVPGTSTTNFTGTLAQFINGTAVAQTFYNVVVLKTAGTLLTTGGSTVTLNTNNLTETTGDFTAPTTLNINATPTASLLISTGSFTAGTTINITGNWTYDGGNFFPGTNTVNFTGTLGQVIGGLAISQTFYNVFVLKAVGSTLSTGGSTTTITTNNLTETTGNFMAPATLNINATANSSLTLNAGTFTAGTTINIKGNWTNNGATIVPGMSTTFFNGTLAQAINGTATSQTFYNIVVAKLAGTTLSVGGSTNTLTANNFTETTGNFTACATFNVNATPTSTILLTSGTFTMGTTVNLTGNWTDNGATVVPGTSTVNFSGAGAQLIGGSVAAETFNHIVFLNGSTTSIGYPITCGNLTINSGDTVTVGTTGFTISMKGNWTNGGFFNSGLTGTVVCLGSTAQVIGGTATTIFRNLTIQNGSGVNLAANESIRGTLTLTSGMFTTTGFDFTLLSNATSTARIAEITGGDITGNIIMQRYMFSGPTNWRQMCGPVTGTTLQDWNDDLVTSGFPGSDFPAMTFYSIANYTESVAGPKENGYSPPTNVTNPLTPKKGYFVYVGPLPVPVAVKGPAVKMNQTFSLTYTPSAGPTQDGWNMLGNPYPSSIDWDATGWTRTNTDNVLYIWNPTLGQYAAYVNGVGVNGGSKNIPSSQAFWVRAIGPSPSMTLNETVKTAVDQPFMHSAQIQSNGDLLSLTIKGTPGADQSIIRFDPVATDTFDVNYDALKLGSMDTTVPYLASVITNLQELSINTLPNVTSNITVPLRVHVGVSGNYIIRRDTISDLPNSMCLVLEDLLTGSTTQLTQGASYSFNISDTTNAIRFLLHIGASLTTGEKAATCTNSPNGTAFATGTGIGPWDYVWKNSAGNIIATHNAVAGSDTLFGLVPGSYIVEVNGNDGYCGLRIDTIVVSGPVPIQTGATITPLTCSYTNDGQISINVVTGGVPPYTLTWSDGSHGDSLSNLSIGNYALIVTDSNGCVDTAHFLVNTNSTLNAAFTATPDTVNLQSLIWFVNGSSGAFNYTWDFGDSSPFTTTSDPVYSYGTSGTFTVMLVADDGTCLDTAVQTVFVVNNTSIQEQNQGTIGVATDQESIGLLFNLPSVQKAVIKVYDAHGKLYADEEDYVGQGRVNIPMIGAASQMYLVVVQLPDRVYSTKVVLIR